MPESEEENTNADSSPVAQANDDDRPAPVEVSEGTLDSEMEEWQRLMKDAIDRLNVPTDEETEISKLDRVLINLWQNLAKNPAELKAGLDEYIRKSLLPSLSGADPREKGSANVRHAERTASEGGPNHNTRKKTGYARCQELFELCPKRLADAAIRGSLDFMEYRQSDLKGQAIKDLYSNLWGTRLTVSYKPDTRHAMGIARFFSPFTEEDVVNRISKILSSSAAGPDLVKKVHLRKRGLPIVLAKVYNILILVGHYPEP